MIVLGEQIGAVSTIVLARVGLDSALPLSRLGVLLHRSLSPRQTQTPGLLLQEKLQKIARLANQKATGATLIGSLAALVSCVTTISTKTSLAPDIAFPTLISSVLGKVIQGVTS